MRVLLVGSQPRLGARNRLAWLAHTAAGLRRLGHDVTVAGYRESWASSPRLAGQVGLVPGGSAALARLATELEARQWRRLAATAGRVRAQLTVVLKGETMSGETIAAVKQATDGPLVSWWVDDPFVYPAAVRELWRFNRVFVFDRSYLPALASAGVAHAEFLPCACDDSVYRPTPLGERERRRYGADVSFVASYYPARAALVRALAQAGIDVGVWGTGWHTAAAQTEAGGRLVPRGGTVTDRGAAKIYNASKIGVNIHHPQTRLAGLNMRTFELLAAGTLPLTDRVPGMEELLEPGRDLACYTSPDDAADLARRYLKDERARAEIVARGRARVLAEHTYETRMATLCRIAAKS